MRERRVRVEQLTDGNAPIQTYAKGKGPSQEGTAKFNRTYKKFTLNGKTFERVEGGHWSGGTHFCTEDQNYYRLYQMPDQAEMGPSDETPLV